MNPTEIQPETAKVIAGRASSNGTAWLKLLRPLMWMVPMIALVGVAGVFAANRWSESQQAVELPPQEIARQPIRVAVARQEAIQAWVFAEGTSRSVRREYMTFEMTGRVTFVGPKKEGQKVKQGEVLALLDKRKYTADVDAALASIQEAKTKAQASAADTGQAQTQYELTLSQFNRIKGFYDRNAGTKSEYEEAEARLENAKAAVEAAKAQSLAVASQIDVADAKLRQAKVALEGAEIVSPIDGIVAYLNIEEGNYYTQSNVKTNSEAEALQTIPMVVIDPSEYEITVDVPSFEAGRIEVGQQVLLLPGGTSEKGMVAAMNGSQGNSPASTGDWQARGEVYSVNPAVNPGGRSIQVKVRTIIGANHLRDGMFVTCWIATEDKPEAIVAPYDALLYEENRPYVFVYQPETQTVQRRDVTLGIQGLTNREILSGVKAGETLVTDGRYRLVEGAPVRVLEPKAASPLATVGLHRFDRALESLPRPRETQNPRLANKLAR